MKKMLITGGTVFVSRFSAEYFLRKGYDVTVLNRNTRPQCGGVTLIEADRHALGESLRNHHFDVILDITAYTGEDVSSLLNAVGGFEDYILISSSAVYPECAAQPFTEETPVGANKIWGKYGTDKLAAETVLRERVPHAYVLRPPYLYGPMNNVYREAFVFDCAMQGRPFYLPKGGEMKLQFFHVADLCRFIEVLLEKKPEQRVFNVGNRETVSVKDWVSLCYQAAGKVPSFVSVAADILQRSYFCFHDYDYYLDVSKQYALMPDGKPLEEGIGESFYWYTQNENKVGKRPYLSFIQENL